MKILFFLLLLTGYGEVTAQFGSLKGRVTENGSALPGVTIVLQKTDFGTQSASNGSYEIGSIPEGSYTIRFSAVGYETVLRDIEIKSGSQRLDIEMKPVVILTDEVQVLGERKQSQQDPRVSLIDLRPEKARIQPGAVQDVLRTLQSLPGVLAPNDFTSQLIIRGSG
ncbi:MAG: carboxypeptidase-like regulatory domain-containing protein, partial [Ignavibacteria bacterium]|nr:carboxypeptidase-like regulatory domain-containing protein [Ignavibacteria bacterium]